MFSEEQYPLTIGMLLFDEVEVLDFCGPFEVFSVTKWNDQAAFRVLTLAQKKTISARNGLRVEVHATLEASPTLDILLVPGGQGTRTEIDNRALLAWLSVQCKSVPLILSVCTGALLLAKTGLLNGLQATTHHKGVELLRKLAPKTEILPERRYVDNGRVVLSAGISAGIDMSFHIVERLLGAEVALQTARHMEYDWPKEH